MRRIRTGNHPPDSWWRVAGGVWRPTAMRQLPSANCHAQYANRVCTNPGVDARDVAGDEWFQRKQPHATSIDLNREKRQGLPWLRRALCCCALVGLSAGCTTLPPPPAWTPIAPPPSTTVAGAARPAPAAIRELLLTERQAAIAGDLPALAEIWAIEGRVVDSRGTVDPADDYLWPGRAAVLDRYVVAVFPNPPPPLTLPADLFIEMDGDVAIVRHGGDRWRFVQQNGRWWIAELIYNQPHEPDKVTR
jgi:hypothetical protein